MLGIIVDANVEKIGAAQLFHKFGDKTALERLLETCSKVESSHKVILSMAAADKILINGSVFQTKLAGKLDGIENYGRKVEAFFYGRADEESERLLRIGLHYQLDEIVHVSAANVLTPKWLIRHAIKTYRLAKGITRESQNYPAGIAVSVFPFWAFAEFYAENNPGSVQIFLDAFVKETAWCENSKPNDFPELPETIDLSVGPKMDTQMLSRIFDELDNGIDLADIMEDFLE